jgi:ferredoxin-type protein NapH
MTTEAATRKMATRQKVRLSLLFLIMLTFPITMNYFSVYLIIESAGQGIVAFTLLFWSAFVVTALLLGRAACGYICPLGALQETKDRMAPKNRLARIKYLKIVKYVLAVAWVGGIIAAVISAGGYKTINLLYNMPSGVSVDSPQNWIMWGMIVLIVLLPAFFIGKRGFCHYFCPWGVLNMVATKIKDCFRLPSLHLIARKEECKQCHSCDRACPMSLPVSVMTKNGSMKNNECILCGTCADTCPNGVIEYSWSRLLKI